MKKMFIGISAAVAAAAIASTAYVIKKNASKKKKSSDRDVNCSVKKDDTTTVYARAMEYCKVKLPENCPANAMLHVHGEARVPKDLVDQVNMILDIEEMELGAAISKAEWLAEIGFEVCFSVYNYVTEHKPNYWGFSGRYEVPAEIDKLSADISKLTSGVSPDLIYPGATYYVHVTRTFAVCNFNENKTLNLRFGVFTSTTPGSPLSKFVEENFETDWDYFDSMDPDKLLEITNQFVTIEKLNCDNHKRGMSHAVVTFSWLRSDRTGYSDVSLPVNAEALTEVINTMKAYNDNPNEETDAALAAVIEKCRIYDEYCVDDEGYLTDD